jgi:formyl-CoA transferase/CoA:oxalate CoA-transferase
VLPLDHLTILDLSRVMAGPYASMLLADFGARVIKVEPPEGDDTRGYGPPWHDGDATYYLSANRNKRSIAIDLKHADGPALVRRLAARADVLLENFRPGTLDRLGLPHAQLLAENPRLIVCSISGFGHAGLPEHSRKPGYDLMIQGLGGIPSLTGPADGPPCKVGTSIADLAAGLYATIGILVALEARARTGRGQHVDVSMLDGQIALLSYHAQAHLAGAPAVRHGNAHPSVAPYQTYRARDGWVNIAVANDRHWRGFCERVLGRPELAADARFATNARRVEARAALAALLEPLVATRDVADWVAACDAAGVPAGPILGVAEALAHPQVLARAMVTEVDGFRTLGVPVKLSETPGAVRSRPPRRGEHGRDLLAELLALDPAEIDRLIAEGVVLRPER